MKVGSRLNVRKHLVAAFCLALGTLLSDTCTWSGAVDGYWTNSANWVEGRVPGRYLVPDGAGGFTTNGVLREIAVFGNQLTGNKVTTIDFDGVYSISNLLTVGTHRYTYGTQETQFLPLEPYGVFSAAETAETPAATVVCRIQTGVEVTDRNPGNTAGLWGGETIVIRNNSTETFVLDKYGWRTKCLNYVGGGGETGLQLEGSGDIRVDGPLGQGGQQIPQFKMGMVKGRMIINTNFVCRTFNVVAGGGDATTERQVVINKGCELKSSSVWYNWFYVSAPVRISGEGRFWLSTGYNKNGPNSGNAAWKNTGFTVNADVTFDCPNDVCWGTVPTAENGGLAFNQVAEIFSYRRATFLGTGSVDGRDYYDGVRVFYRRGNNTSDPVLELEKIGTAGTYGSIGDVDYLLSDRATLRYVGSGETMGRTICVTNVFEAKPAVLEHAGTGDLRVVSSFVRADNSQGSSISLVNSSQHQAVFAGNAANGLTVIFGGGEWIVDEGATFSSPLSVAPSRIGNQTKVRFTDSRALTKFSSTDWGGNSSLYSAVYLDDGVEIEVTDLSVNYGAKVDFILGAGAKLKVTNPDVNTGGSGSWVKLNGHSAVFDANGYLVMDPDAPENVWKEPASGFWSTAANWSKGVPDTASETLVDAVGGDYVVTIDGAAVATNLTVKNAGSGTATLAIDGTANAASLTITDATLTVGEGGRVVMGGADARMDLSVISTQRRAVVLKNGGVLSVTGGVMKVDNRGNGQQQSGSSTVEVQAGSLLEVKGDATFVDKGIPGNTGSVFMKFDGGTFRFDDNAVFNTEATYSDTAPSKGNSVFYHKFNPSKANVTSLWEFVGSSRTGFSGTPWALEVGVSGYAGTKSTLRLNTAYSGQMNFWNLNYVGGGKYGNGELLLERGNFKAGNYNFNVGCTGSGDAIVNASGCSTYGLMSISDGASLYYQGGQGLTTGESHGFCGLGFGKAAGLQNDQSTVRGRLELTGGALTNQYGFLEIGSGPSGVGEIEQSGGVFVSQPANSWAEGLGRFVVSSMIGIFGGRGTYHMTGGEFHSTKPMWVGGATTNDLCRYHRNGTYIENYHNATGLIQIEGGTFEVKNTVRLGRDGTGAIELSGEGLVKIDTLVVSNTVGQAASYLKFTADAQGRMGTLQADTLAFAEGSKIVLDLTAWPEKLTRAPLATLTNPVVGWDNVKDAVEMGDNAPNGAKLMLTNEGRTLSFVVQKGTVLIFR